ncbi:MAG TPA: cytochrome c [Alcanivoracaceae bacterium]|nr:cytochrome c [Alcanivoracaceae bacterium]
MKTTISMALLGAVLSLGLTTNASAEQEERINIGEQLPDNVRGLLIQEMLGIQAASQKIQAAIVQGDHDVVATEAQAIHDSFIMEQEMTEEDERALLAVAPEDFLEQDEALHTLSASLAEAGRNKDTDAQLKHLHELLEGCVSCHSDYASARFPGL